MTTDEMVKVAKWGVDVADKYRVAVADVINVFKALYKYNGDIDKTKNMVIEGIHAR